MDELWQNSIDRLESRREAVLAAGGAERIAKQHASGKLTARERMEALFDDGTFVELNDRLRIYSRPCCFRVFTGFHCRRRFTW